MAAESQTSPESVEQGTEPVLMRDEEDVAKESTPGKDLVGAIVIGVFAYVIVPFLRDIALGMQWTDLAHWLELGVVRVTLALAASR